MTLLRNMLACILVASSWTFGEDIPLSVAGPGPDHSTLESAARQWVLERLPDLEPDAAGLPDLSWALARWTTVDATEARLSAKYATILMERFGVWREIDRALRARSFADEWRRAVSAHVAHRLCAWRLPDTAGQWNDWLKGLPELGTERVIGGGTDLEAALREWDPGWDQRSPGEKRRCVFALFSANPHVPPAGFLRSDAPDPQDPGVDHPLADGRIHRDRWRIEAPTPLWFPDLAWARRFQVPEIELENPEPVIERHFFRLPKSLGGQHDLLLRVVLRDGRFELADLMAPSLQGRAWSLFPVASRFDPRSPQRPIEPMIALPGEDLLDLPAAKPSAPLPSFHMDAKSLHGVLGASLRGPMREDAVELHLDLDRARGVGTFRLLWAGGVLGKGDLLPEGAPPPGIDPVDGSWRSWLGDGGGAAAPDLPRWREDPAEAAAVWLADTLVPDGRGPDTRGKVQYLEPGQSTMGGWASPVVGDGLVVLSYYLPAGDALAYGAKASEGERVRANRILADDVVHAFDLQTGHTRWQRRMPGGLSWAGFNKGGPQLSPALADGLVVSVGTTGRVFCHELATGRERWRHDIGDRRWMMESLRESLLAEKSMLSTRNDFQFNVVIAGDVVVLSDQRRTRVDFRYEADFGLLGLDLRTGRRLWHLPEVAGNYKDQQGAQAIRLEGRDFVLAPGREGVSLIDPQRGVILWTCPDLVLRGSAFAYGEGLLVGDRPGGETEEAGAAGVVAIRIRPDGWEPAWTLPAPWAGRRGGGVRIGDVVYLQLAKPEMGLYAIDARDGLVLARETAPLASGEHCPYVLAAGGRLLAPLDRTVGLVSFAADPQALPGSARTLLAPFATGYCGSLLPALVDGRMLVRTRDRLLCLDLREVAPAPTEADLWTPSAWNALFPRRK